MVTLLKFLILRSILRQYLGPTGASLVIVGVIVTILVLARHGERVFEWLGLKKPPQPLRGTMTGASVAVHSVAPVSGSDPAAWPGDDELGAAALPSGEYDWYAIDATITPPPGEDGAPAGWHPAMLQVVRADDQVLDPLAADLNALIARAEQWHDGRFAPLEFGTVHGAARIRLLAGVGPGTTDVQISYCGDSFGRLRLPSRPRVSASA